MAVNFSKNQDEITKAWKNVVDSKGTESWALFGYEGNTNNIRLMSTGTDGLGGLVGGLNCSLIQYGFCRVINTDLGLNKLILINWQGDSSPLSRKGLCASHVADVTNYFKGCTQTITIRNDDEATVEYLIEQITKSSSASRINLAKHYNPSAAAESTSKVGSTYSRTDINSEIPIDRKSFWQRQEEEEKERLLEEKKRAQEKQAQFEKERKAREEKEAQKLAEAIKERDRLIDATRQAERRESSASQATSAPLSGATTRDDDDERVGRRSELLRLERNQETQSLIEKGLIKNKRAIFEQASQQQQSSTNNIPRKSSGTMVAQRLNSFKSLESSSSSTTSTTSNNPKSIEKLSNGFASQVSLSNESAPKSIASEKVETIQITKDQQLQHSAITAAPEIANAKNLQSPTKIDPVKVEPVKAEPVEGVAAMGNGQVITNGSSDTNCNSIHRDLPDNTTKAESGISLDDIIQPGKIGIKAKAMYDYEAADDTEISFDPDDIIGFIDKVDSGWWHGSVVSGRFKGKTGLFPANHVMELQ